MALEALVLSQLVDPFLCYSAGSTTGSGLSSSSMLSHYYDLGTTPGFPHQFVDPLLNRNNSSCNKFPVSSPFGVYEAANANKSIHHQQQQQHDDDNNNPVVASSITVGGGGSTSTSTVDVNNHFYSALISGSSPIGSDPNIPTESSVTATTTTPPHIWDQYHNQMYGHSYNFYSSSSSSPPPQQVDHLQNHHRHAASVDPSGIMQRDGEDNQHPHPHHHHHHHHHHRHHQVMAVAPTVTIVGTKRKRRRRSTKNKEEVENQRMTHIAVERNRRKQMNEYLSVIRSLMPTSYVQRGDQASIVGGAINYVKELEQLLQTLESQNRKPSSSSAYQHDYNHHQPDQAAAVPEKNSPFSNFFTFPQYSTHKSSTRSSGSSPSSLPSSDDQNIISITNYDEEKEEEMQEDRDIAAGEIEVTMAENHANVKILSKRQPRQLLKLVTGFQSLRLSVLHLNVTSTPDHFVLYSFSLKVEDGCHLSSVDDIATAANHILRRIQREEDHAS